MAPCRVFVLQPSSSAVGSTFALNLNFIVHYSNLHLLALFSSPVLVTGLFWLVTSPASLGSLVPGQGLHCATVREFFDSFPQVRNPDRPHRSGFPHFSPSARLPTSPPPSAHTPPLP